MVDRLLCADAEIADKAMCVEKAIDLIIKANPALQKKDFGETVKKDDPWMLSVGYTHFMTFNRKKTFFRLSRTFKGNKKIGFFLYMQQAFFSSEYRTEIGDQLTEASNVANVKVLLQNFK